jgi:hypothetical protein
MGCNCQQPLGDVEPGRSESSWPWYAWALIGLGGFFVVGSMKMGAFHERYGKATEKRCEHYKTVGAYNRCVERELRGKHV